VRDARVEAALRGCAALARLSPCIVRYIGNKLKWSSARNILSYSNIPFTAAIR